MTNTRRAPSIRRKDDLGRDGSGLVSMFFPRWVPFAPRHVEEGPHRGRALFFTRAELNEFHAQWNDSEEWGGRYGLVDWDPSDWPEE